MMECSVRPSGGYLGAAAALALLQRRNESEFAICQFEGRVLQ